MQLKWLNNPATKKPDTMLTLATASTVVVLLRFVLSNLSFGAVTLGQLDAGVVAAILTPTLGAYVARRYSDAKSASESSDSNEKSS